MTTTTAERAKRPGILALGAATAGAMAAATMGSVPTANATCASFFGIGSGGNCTSTLTSIAIAIGENAEAHAEGILGAALTWGNSSRAIAATGGLANLAVSLGDSNLAYAGGIASLAFAGRSTTNQMIFAGLGDATSGSVGNIAVSIASPESTSVTAAGLGNLAVNIAGSGSIISQGVGLTTINLVGLDASLNNRGTLNAIANVSGDNISIRNDEGDGGIGNLGFNVIGENNLISTRGVLALGGAIGSTGQTVSQDGPGVNIAFGRNAVAPGSAKKSSPFAASSVSTPGATADDSKGNRKARGSQARANRDNR